MGCCGKRKKTYDAHQKFLARGSSRSATVAPSVPKSAVAPSSAQTSGGSGTRNVYIEQSGGACPSCGSRTVLKRQYSERLRRYFNVAWCSTCKGAI
jgi:hypothetical protein